MRHFLWFALGLGALALSYVLKELAGWLFAQLSEGELDSVEFLTGLYEFVSRLIRQLAQRFSGRVAAEFDDLDDDEGLLRQWH